MKGEGAASVGTGTGAGFWLLTVESMLVWFVGVAGVLAAAAIAPCALSLFAWTWLMPPMTSRVIAVIIITSVFDFSSGRPHVTKKSASTPVTPVTSLRM